MRKGKQFYLKTNLIGFIVGTIIFGGVAVYAAVTFPSNDVSYDNTNSGLSSTNVKGAIDELYKECTTTTASQIIDGLEKDPYECRYFFTGSNPNNYITFNGEKDNWRIISAECDGTIKIMTTKYQGYKEWDTSGSFGSNNWARPATLNTYLNSTYLNNTLNSTARSQIVSHAWSIGAVTSDNKDLADQINDEKSSQWTGKIALPTLSEYIRSNSNKNDCGTFYLNEYNFHTCSNSNWMYDSYDWWTLSPNTDWSHRVFFVSTDGGDISDRSADSTPYSYRPALYLSSKLKLSGSGTQSDPYIIK